MLLEPHRSRYLRALGIEVYVPRQPLPGAAVSQPVAWEPEKITGADLSLKPAAVHVENSGGDGVSMPQTKPSLLALDVGVGVVRSPQSTRASETPKSPIAPKVEVPRFALMIIRCEAGIVVVDEAPRGDQRREAYLRLLGNLLFALYRRPVVVETDLFVWPMVKNPSVDQSEQAARESLSAYLQRQCTLINGKTLIALGSGASRWVNSDPAFHVVAGSSLWRCLADSAAKQTLWSQLQPLRAQQI